MSAPLPPPCPHPEGEGSPVECYSGHTYAQEPRAVTWQGERRRVTGVEWRWRTPDGPAFRVQTEGGARFELHYDERAGCWRVRAAQEGGPIEDKEVRP